MVIERDRVGGRGQHVQVMTIWLGLWLPTPMPPVFETLVHGAGGSRPRRWVWARVAEAQAGHQQIVGELTIRRGEFLGEEVTRRL